MICFVTAGQTSRSKRRDGHRQSKNTNWHSKGCKASKSLLTGGEPPSLDSFHLEVDDEPESTEEEQESKYAPSNSSTSSSSDDEFPSFIAALTKLTPASKPLGCLAANIKEVKLEPTADLVKGKRQGDKQGGRGKQAKQPASCDDTIILSDDDYDLSPPTLRLAQSHQMTKSRLSSELSFQHMLSSPISRPPESSGVASCVTSKAYPGPFSAREVIIEKADSTTSAFTRRDLNEAAVNNKEGEEKEENLVPMKQPQAGAGKGIANLKESHSFMETESLKEDLGSNDSTPLLSPSSCITSLCSKSDTTATLHTLNQLKELIETGFDEDYPTRETSGDQHLTGSTSDHLSSIKKLSALKDLMGTEDEDALEDSADNRDTSATSDVVGTEMEWDYIDISSQPTSLVQGESSDSEEENAIALCAKQVLFRSKHLKELPEEEEEEEEEEASGKEAAEDWYSGSSKTLAPPVYSQDTLESSSAAIDPFDRSFQLPSMVVSGCEISTQPCIKLKEMRVAVPKLQLDYITDITQQGRQPLAGKHQQQFLQKSRMEEDKEGMISLPVAISLSVLKNVPSGATSETTGHHSGPVPSPKIFGSPHSQSPKDDAINGIESFQFDMTLDTPHSEDISTKSDISSASLLPSASSSSSVIQPTSSTSHNKPEQAWIASQPKMGVRPQATHDLTSAHMAPRSRDKGVIHSAKFSRSRLPPLLGSDRNKPTHSRKRSINSNNTRSQSKSQSAEQDKACPPKHSGNPSTAAPASTIKQKPAANKVPHHLAATAAGKPQLSTTSLTSAPSHPKLPHIAVETKPKTVVKLNDLHNCFLSWDPTIFLYPEIGADGQRIRPLIDCSLPSAIPDVFPSYGRYFNTFTPLLLMELWDTVSQLLLYMYS